MAAKQNVPVLWVWVRRRPSPSGAQQWLMSGQVDIPSARWLACSVNGYERRGDVATFSEWVRIQLPFITTDLIGSLSIQELLDLLFYFHRRGTICGGYEARKRQRNRNNCNLNSSSRH